MKLFYRHFGKGWPLIIVHGLYGSSDNWLTVAKKLEKHFSIYLIDLRNHGQSPHSEVHSYKALADDIQEFINDNKIKSPILIGHSMGGKAVMQFGLQAPDFVHKMVVVDIAPARNDIRHHKKHILEHQNIIAALRSLPLDKIERRSEAETYLAERIPDERVRSFLLKNLTRHDNMFAWRLNLKVLAKEIESIMDGFSMENPVQIGQKSFPILFIKGEKSDYIEEEDINAIKIFYPNAQITTIANAGHWVHAEQTDDFIAAVTNFCSEEFDFT